MNTIKKTARTTGLWYLGLALAGIVGFLAIRSELYVSGDASATAANLVANESLARLGIAMDMAIVITQALAAVYFYKLLRGINSFAAASIAAFGLVNAVAILVAVGLTATALNVALAGGDAATVQVLYDASTAMWNVGGLFFGLWLIPMGYVVYTAKIMPRALGIILVAGGFGYIISTFVTYLAPDAPPAVNAILTGLATIGEFWIIGYLLFVGVRPSALTSNTPPTAAA